MFDVAERLTNIRLLIGLFGLFALANSAPTFENGILPHFKVDHVAGKLKISASRDAADISYKNDNVDLTVKPNNKEQAKVVMESIKDSSKLATTKRDEPLNTKGGTTRSIKDKPNSSDDKKIVQSRRQRIHFDSSYSDDIGMRRSNIKKHNEDADEHEERKETDGSDITWRGRINHSPDEPDNNHVLSALNEIKSLMTLSMKPPNLKAFDQVLPVDTTDKYLNTDTVVKKLGHTEHKKRRTEAAQDNQYIRKAKGALHSNLHNNSYPEEPVEYAYGQKGHADPYLREQHHARKSCKGDRCRIIRRHRRKNCVRGRCRQEMFANKEYGNSEGAFEELYLGKIKEHHNGHENVGYRNRDPDYDTLGDSEEQTSHRKTHKSTYVAPYHGQNEDAYHSLYGDDDHHGTSQEMDGFHGAHNSAQHNSNSPDSAFEKEFENKINDKEYNTEGGEVHHDVGEEHHEGGEGQHHMAAHHTPTHDDDYLDDGGGGPHEGEQHVGSYAHGEDEELGLYQHNNDNLGELPSESHHVHNNYHDHDTGESENHNRGNEHDHNSPVDSYDFDETKEIKNEEHDDPNMEHLNGKLKDWYNANAMGSTNATNTMDEPAEGEIIVATSKNPKSDASGENKTSSEDKKIESKFEDAGEKPLNSTETEQAISKLNESLANSLNESTMNAISSYGNDTNSTESTNSTKAAALNSFNNLKLDASSNDTQNAQANDNVDSSNTTNPSENAEIESDAANATNAIFNVTHDVIKQKIGILEKKVNSSGDLLKQLEEIEKKLNSTTSKNKSVEALKKPLTSAEKELLRVSPEDILQTHLPSSDDIEALHNTNVARHINGTVDSDKNATANATVHKPGGLEKAYATIGEPDLKDSNKNATSKDNKTHSEEGSGEEGGSGQGIHAEKHAELKKEKEKDITSDKTVPDTSEQTHHKTKVYENGAEIGLLKRHKTKGSLNRRHKVKEHIGTKRHHKPRRHGRY